MSDAVLLLIGSVLGTTATVLVARWTLRQQARQTRTTDAQQIIDQLQEIAAEAEARHQREVAAAEARHQREIADVRAELGAVKDRMAVMEDHELILLDYVAELRHHIDQRNPPPPPPWPTALLRRLRRDRRTEET